MLTILSFSCQSKSVSDPSSQFLAYKARFMDILMSWETKLTACQVCSTVLVDSQIFWKCTTCWPSPIFCTICCKKEHERHPLHRVHRWTGTHWLTASLKDTGLVVHLGHGGLPCPVQLPQSEEDDTALFDEDPEVYKDHRDFAGLLHSLQDKVF